MFFNKELDVPPTQDNSNIAHIMLGGIASNRKCRLPLTGKSLFISNKPQAASDGLYRAAANHPMASLLYIELLLPGESLFISRGEV